MFVRNAPERVGDVDVDIAVLALKAVKRLVHRVAQIGGRKAC